jgi:hypothetical protein
MSVLKTAAGVCIARSMIGMEGPALMFNGISEELKAKSPWTALVAVLCTPPLLVLDGGIRLVGDTFSAISWVKEKTFG